jgi:hypothetical protein
MVTSVLSPWASFWRWPEPGAERGLPTREGDRVRFHLSDVFLPTPEEVSALSTADAEMEGTIISFSDSGAKLNYFAVVDVVRKQSVVVAVDKLNVIPAERRETDR